MYLKNKQRNETSLSDSLSKARVTVQLPVYNERMVVIRLIQAVAAFDWPAEQLEIQVLDDSDDDTTELIRGEVCRLQAEGVNISHLRRDSRSGFKAGALEYGLKFATGDFIAIFDADNVPEANFLRLAMSHFEESDLGLVQGRWTFINRDQSLLCRAQALYLDAHFLIEQSARSAYGLFMNFNGTAGLWRRAAIIQSGGWQPDTLTEDLDLSYRAQLAGWRMKFCERIEVPTELPQSIRAFKTQQFRWAKGCFETGRKLLPKLLGSALPLRVKIGSFFHLTQRTTGVALLVLAILLIPALYIRIESGVWKVFAVDLPIFLAGTGSMSIYYGLAYRRGHEDRTWKTTFILPALTSLGIGLSANTSHALLSTFLRRNSDFVRTPKSGVLSAERVALPQDYRVRYDNTLKLEFLLGLYTVAALVCAIWLKLYFSVPFLATFSFGFTYFAALSYREAHE